MNQEQEELITQLTNRHIGKCLARLKEAGAPEVYLQDVKREFWYLADDIKSGISQNQETNHELSEFKD